MSDLSSAAEAMGVPEPLVERSARAWADANDQAYEDVLTAWAGGETAPAAPAAEPAPAEEADEEEGVPAEEAAPPEEAPAVEPAPAQPAAAAPPAAETTAARPAAVGRPPILEGSPDRPLVTVFGGLGVLVLGILLGFVFPSLPAASDQVRSSEVPYTKVAEEGRSVYVSAGCASCHTQVVRSVVADVGLGPVTLPDTNQVVGYRRLAPDLSDIGSRLSQSQLASAFQGGSHPPLVLSDSELDSLLAYLTQSATSPEGNGEADGDDNGEDQAQNGDEQAAEEGAES